MDRTDAVSAVVLFAGTLLTSTADDQPTALEWLSGPSGRRLAVALTEIIELHRPDSAGRCPDCRLSPGPTASTCRTWRTLVRALAGGGRHLARRAAPASPPPLRE